MDLREAIPSALTRATMHPAAVLSGRSENLVLNLGMNIGRLAFSFGVGMHHAGFRTIDQIFGTGHAEGAVACTRMHAGSNMQEVSHGIYVLVQIYWRVGGIMACLRHSLAMGMQRAGAMSFKKLIARAAYAGDAVACTLLHETSSSTSWMNGHAIAPILPCFRLDF